MKRNHQSIFATIFGVSAVLLGPALANAQTGPSGSFTNTVSAPTNAVWDFGGVITNVVVDVAGKGGTTAHFSFPVAVQQSGTGKMSGSGDTTVQLDFDGVPLTFTGAYKVTGSLASARGGSHALFDATVAGSTTLPGDTKARKISASHQDNAVINSATAMISGKRKLVASASGKGSIVENQNFGPLLLSSVGQFGDGSWALTLTVSTTGKKVTGTGFVVLNSGQTFHYTVTGLFNLKNNTSKLVLTGSNTETKGSTLQVTMTGSTVANIKGRISGQTVNASF